MSSFDYQETEFSRSSCCDTCHNCKLFHYLIIIIDLNSVVDRYNCTKLLLLFFFLHSMSHKFFIEQINYCIRISHDFFYFNMKYVNCSSITSDSLMYYIFLSYWMLVPTIVERYFIWKLLQEILRTNL